MNKETARAGAGTYVVVELLPEDAEQAVHRVAHDVDNGCLGVQDVDEPHVAVVEQHLVHHVLRPCAARCRHLGKHLLHVPLRGLLQVLLHGVLSAHRDPHQVVAKLWQVAVDDAVLPEAANLAVSVEDLLEQRRAGAHHALVGSRSHTKHTTRKPKVVTGRAAADNDRKP